MEKETRGKGLGKGMFVASWEKLRGEKGARKGEPKSQSNKSSH